MFFGFSRNETRAFLILLPLMSVLIFVIPAWRQLNRPTQNDFAKEKRELDSIITAWTDKEVADSLAKISSTTLFAFNPNLATEDELGRLGFSTSLAKRIINYRNKGGKFKIKSDVLKLYGMDSTLYTRLYAFIELPENLNHIKKDSAFKKTDTQKPTARTFDINTADTTQLMRIYGIGSKLSARIIKYRESLGGFISMDQLTEVYGLDSAVIASLKAKSFISENYAPRTLSINATTEKELGAHPYIRYKLAKAITAYRFQHGNFSSLDELRNISIIDSATFEKIKPYLSLTH